MSKWKYIRESNLRRYCESEYASGLFLGAAIGSLPFAVPLAFIFLIISAVAWYQKLQFDRIRRTIDDAGGGA